MGSKCYWHRREIGNYRTERLGWGSQNIVTEKEKILRGKRCCGVLEYCMFPEKECREAVNKKFLGFI